MKRRPQPAQAAIPALAGAPALRALLRARWERYRQELRTCRREFSAGSVHESRVAARRLRAALELLAAVAGTAQVGKARRALKRHLRLFAELRDAQAQQALLPALRLPAELRERFAAFLRHREAKATRRARRDLKELSTHSVAKAVRQLDALLRHETQAVGEAELREVVETRFTEVRQRRAQVDPQRPETIHATRVAFKRFRYSVELLAPLLPGRHPVRVAAMRRHQALLGAVQDAAVSIQWFAAFAARTTAQAAAVERVRQRLLRRRERAITRYLVHADDLSDFWPL